MKPLVRPELSTRPVSTYKSGIAVQTNRATSRSLGHVPLIDHNPRKGTKIEFAPAEAVRYNERTAAERSNARDSRMSLAVAMSWSRVPPR